MLENVKFIVIHCSQTLDLDPDINSDQKDITHIHHWHVRRGMPMVGYHFVITRHPRLEAGRPLFMEGQHVNPEIDAESIAICLIGRKDFNEHQIRMLTILVGNLLKLYPEAQVVGHNALADVSCPNFDVIEWWALNNGETKE